MGKKQDGKPNQEIRQDGPADTLGFTREYNKNQAQNLDGMGAASPRKHAQL